MKPGRFTGMGTALLLAMGLTLPTTYAIGADMDVMEKVKTAKTAADHEAIAKYYDSEAAAAKKQADLHRKMAETYSAGGGIGKGTGPIPLPQHCQALAKEADEEAAHYTAMAETHRALAKAAK
jgi:hypothetical protein